MSIETGLLGMLFCAVGGFVFAWLLVRASPGRAVLPTVPEAEADLPTAELKVSESGSTTTRVPGVEAPPPDCLERLLHRLLLVHGEESGVREVLSMLSERFAPDRVEVGCFGEGERSYEVEYARGKEFLFGAGGVPGYASAMQKFFTCNDFAKISNVTASPYASDFAANSIRSVIAAPLMENERVSGMLALFFTERERSFSAEDGRVVRNSAKILKLVRERFAQSERLADAAREKQLMLDHVRIPIFLYDAQGELRRVNRATCEIAGMAEPELLKVDCNSVFCKLLVRDQSCPVKEVLSTGKTASRRFRIADRDCLVCAEPVLDGTGGVTGVVKSVIDMTGLPR